MQPTLTLFGHGPVPAYELMLALGACALVAVVAGSAALQDLPRARLFAWLTGTYLAAILGARVAFAASRLPRWDEAARALGSIDAVGFSSFGAVALGALTAWWLARRLGLPFERLARPLAIGGCLFGAIARVGCFLAGCCHGLPTAQPWGVAFPEGSPAATLYGHGVAVHPFPLYEAALLVAIAAAATLPGRHAVRLAAAYLLGRFALEFLRGDVARYDGLTTAQWLALGALALAAAALLSATFDARARAPRLRGVSSE